MKHYNSLDGLRALAAIGILIMHVRANVSYSPQLTGVAYNIITNLWYFVYLFFILSAFGMCCGYYERMKNNQISINQFYTKRYIKILPFFALLVLLDTVISGINLQNISEGFANLTLTFALFPQDIKIISVGWTLGVVFAFYMLFPWFIFLVWNKRRAWFTFILSLVLNYLCFNVFHISNHFFMYSLCYFMAGGMIYLYRNEIEKIMNHIKIPVILATIILSIYLLRLSLNDITLLLLFSMWMICFISVDTKLFNNKVIKLISNLSFEIYLCHMVIFRGLEKFGITNIQFVNVHVSYIIMCIVIFSGAMCFSYITKKCIDLVIQKIQAIA